MRRPKSKAYRSGSMAAVAPQASNSGVSANPKPFLDSEHLGAEALAFGFHILVNAARNGHVKSISQL